MEQGTKDAEEASSYSASIYSNGNDKYDFGNENMEDSVESDLEINGLEADAEQIPMTEEARIATLPECAHESRRPS